MDKLFGAIFEQMAQNHQQEQQTEYKVVKEPNKFAVVISLFITIIIGCVFEYTSLTPINLRSPGFLFLIAVLLIIFSTLNLLLSAGTSKVTKYTYGLAGLMVVIVFVGNFISAPIFHAKAYQEQLVLDRDADFYEDNKTISYESMPVVDRDSATRLGDRKMGEIVEYVSQFEVTSSYQQINYNNKPYRVTPLEYSDLIKWFSNRSKGLPAYITVDMVTQNVEVVQLEEGMKYSASELFGRNISRHIRFNYPTELFTEPTFEINDEGVPYYIAPTYMYQIGLFGGKDITGAILVNAITGEHEQYSIEDVPEWVDRVYPSSLVEEQLTNWGKFGNGYLNSVFTQKGVLQPTTGYNYIALDGDVYFYTGLTSVSKDASNVGFALINLRTKESKYYNISGAEEYSAMSSAEGQVQNLGYRATFPILVNAGGEPTYFLSLKDDANLVKQYAFVSVENYQLVATGESVAVAEKAYYKLLQDNGKLDEEVYEQATKTGVISQISEAVKGGNSTYYFTIEGDTTVYIADISLSNHLPLARVGSKISFEFATGDQDSKVISSISFE